MVLAWSLLFGAPVAAAVVADRRYTAPASSVPAGARARQIVAAGLLTNLAGALSVTVSGTGTIAAMLKAAWLRNWLCHGQHLLSVSAACDFCCGAARQPSPTAMRSPPP
jgi:hypothetical protein